MIKYDTALKYHVYAHYKADTNEIFYVGKGCNNRFYKDYKYERSNHWHSIVNKHGYYAELLYQNIDEHTAFALEILNNHSKLSIDYIEEYNRQLEEFKKNYTLRYFLEMKML